MYFSSLFCGIIKYVTYSQQLADMASPGRNMVDADDDADDFFRNLGSSDIPATQVNPDLLANAIRILEHSLKGNDDCNKRTSGSKQQYPVGKIRLSNSSSVNRHLRNGSCKRNLRKMHAR